MMTINFHWIYQVLFIFLGPNFFDVFAFPWLTEVEEKSADTSYIMAMKTRLSGSARTREQYLEAKMILRGWQCQFFCCFVVNANYWFFICILGYWASFEALCERLRIPVRGLASLWEAWTPFETSGLLLRGPASLWLARPPAERGPASLWEAWPPCERPSLPVRGPAIPERGPASLWEARPHCERPGLNVREPASLWKAQLFWEAGHSCEMPCLSLRHPFTWKKCSKWENPAENAFFFAKH